MKKINLKSILHFIFGIFSIVTAVVFIYLSFNPSKIDNFALYIALFFECAFCTVLFIMFENRPMNTELQRKRNEDIMNQGLVCIILLVLFVLVLLFLYNK